jgi:pimeloyl-ACP methyl ester carboxylesterase
MESPQFRDVWITSADGLRLYARDYESENISTPVLCLSGLTRNVRDFEPLIAQAGGRRRFIAMDYRGRGRSQYASDPKTYRVDIEADDALALLGHLGIARAAIIGTSRGGLLAMTLAASAPDKVAGVLFNDIGPVIDKAGLLRIRSYLGKAPHFGSWSEAVDALKRTHAGFDLSDGEWLAYAHRVYREEDGLPRIDYDPRLGETFPSAEEIEKAALPDLWPLFDLLKPLPCAVLRGEHSDLLSEATVTEMARRHGNLIVETVKNRGHVPFLDEPESLSAIKKWLARVDAFTASRAGA